MISALKKETVFKKVFFEVGRFLLSFPFGDLVAMRPTLLFSHHHLSHGLLFLAHTFLSPVEPVGFGLVPIFVS